MSMFDGMSLNERKALVKPFIEEATKELENQAVLLRAEIEGLGSVLLELQQECIELRKKEKD